VPTTVSTGLEISDNTLRNADSIGGAIRFATSWHEGPSPHRWPLANGVLVQHNLIEGMTGSPAHACAREPRVPRVAIGLGNRHLLGDLVLHANQCPGRVGGCMP
jgi:hypothetical protein